jgi:hypothetical protein
MKRPAPLSNQPDLPRGTATFKASATFAGGYATEGRLQVDPDSVVVCTLRDPNSIWPIAGSFPLFGAWIDPGGHVNIYLKNSGAGTVNMTHDVFVNWMVLPPSGDKLTETWLPTP